MGCCGKRTSVSGRGKRRKTVNRVDTKFVRYNFVVLNGMYHPAQLKVAEKTSARLKTEGYITEVVGKDKAKVFNMSDDIRNRTIAGAYFKSLRNRMKPKKVMFLIATIAQPWVIPIIQGIFPNSIVIYIHNTDKENEIAEKEILPEFRSTLITLPPAMKFDTKKETTDEVSRRIHFILTKMP